MAGDRRPPQISPKQHGIECYVSPVKMINLNEVTFIYVHKCTYARGHMHMASQRQVCIGGCVHKSLVCGCSCVCMYTRYIDVACTCALPGFMCIFAQLSICVMCCVCIYFCAPTCVHVFWSSNIFPGIEMRQSVADVVLEPHRVRAYVAGI